MIHRAIIPNCDIVFLPFESDLFFKKKRTKISQGNGSFVRQRQETHLQVMIRIYQLVEILQQLVRLMFRNSIHMPDMMSNSKQRFPAGNWVSPNSGVHRLQYISHILGCPIRML